MNPYERKLTSKLGRSPMSGELVAIFGGSIVTAASWLGLSHATKKKQL